jgi:hypothetical protein
MMEETLKPLMVSNDFLAIIKSLFSGKIEITSFKKEKKRVLNAFKINHFLLCYLSHFYNGNYFGFFHYRNCLFC